MTTVVNLSKDNIFDVYIGRRRTKFHYGNIASHKSGTLAAIRVNTREESIEAYEQWLNGTKYQDIEPERRQWILENLQSLKDKRLGCYCKPLACHGDVLVRLIDGPVS